MRAVLIFLMLFNVFFVTGCESKKRVVVAEKKLPLWYEHPPKSTNTTLYGIGEGHDTKEATLEALNMLLSTLSLSLSSNYSAKTVVKEGTHYNSKDATYIEEIQSHLSTIRINNYEVVQSSKLGFKRYAVLVKVDKIKLFYSLKEQLDLELSALEGAQKTIMNEDALMELAFYRDALESLKDFQERLLVMRTLKSDFNTEPYMQKYIQLKKRYETLAQKITFSIQENNENEEFKTIIQNALLAKKYRIQKRQDRLHYDIFIDIEIKKSHAYGFLLLHTNLKITTKNAKDVIIGSNNITITGQSSTSYGVARHNVVRKFEQIIAKDGIAKVLGVNI